MAAADGDDGHALGDVAEITVRTDDTEHTYDGLDELVEDYDALDAIGYDATDEDGFDSFELEVDGVTHVVDDPDDARQYLEAAVSWYREAQEELDEKESELEEMEAEYEELEEMFEDTMAKNQALVSKLQDRPGEQEVEKLRSQKEDLEDKLEAVTDQATMYAEVASVVEDEQALEIQPESRSHSVRVSVPESMYEEVESGDQLEVTTRFASNKWSPVSIHEKADERSTEYAVESEDLGDVSIDDVGGLDEEYQEMTRTITLQEEAPGLYSDDDGESVLEASGGMLLHGPPGTGKTLLTRAMAAEQDMNLFIVNGPEIMDKWVGNAEEKIREVSQAAKNAAEDGKPSMVVFDELDSIAQERGSSSSNNVGDRVVGQLLSEMDGVDEYGDVYWVGTTNQAELLDPALKRDSRLGKHIEVSRPDREATEQIAEIYMPEEVAERVTEEIAEYDDLESPQVNSGDKISAVPQEATEAFLMDELDENGSVPEAFQDGDLDKEVLAEVPEEYWEDAVESLYSAGNSEPDSARMGFQ